MAGDPRGSQLHGPRDHDFRRHGGAVAGSGPPRVAARHSGLLPRQPRPPILPTLGRSIAFSLELGRPFQAVRREARDVGGRQREAHPVHGRAAYSWAIDAELLDRNPAITARRRRKGRSERKPKPREYKTWKAAEIAAAVHAARGQLVFLPTMLGGWCGLRRGEVCGLRWDDLDLDAGTVSVNRSREQVHSDVLSPRPSPTPATG